MKRRLKAFEEGPDPLKEKFWQRFAEIDGVFGLGFASAGIEGWFTAGALRDIADLLDEYKAARNGD